MGPPGTFTVTRPAGMPADAAEVWDLLARHLAIAGRLQPEDLPALERFCRAYALWRKIQKKLESSPPVKVNKNGTVSLNPHFKALAEVEGQVERGIRHFGLTPAARGAIGRKGKGQDEQEFDDFLASRPEAKPPA